MARSVGIGEGYGDSEFPAPTIRGAAVQGGEDFYIQKLNRSKAEFAMECDLPLVNSMEECEYEMGDSMESDD